MENLRQAIEATDKQCVVLEPETFDRAAIELVTDEEGNLHVKYEVRLIIEVLTAGEDGMTIEEAWEWYYFNIEGAYLGETTPYYKFTPGDDSESGFDTQFPEEDEDD